VDPKTKGVPEAEFETELAGLNVKEEVEDDEDEEEDEEEEREKPEAGNLRSHSNTPPVPGSALG
jgi:hypothetical protein